MPRKCTVCDHEQVGDINKALINNESFRIVSNRFKISKQALQRHNAGHIPKAMTQAKTAAEAAQADTLLDQVKSLQAKACQLLDLAEKSGDLRTALAGVREAKGCLELLAKLQGELQQEGTVNITLAPEWLELRAVILQAVEPYPDAKQRLITAIEGVRTDVV